MKEQIYRQERASGRRFDNAPISLIVHWMHPLRLKAIRGYAVGAIALLATAGCETDGETVPSRTATPLPPTAATIEPRPVLLAQVETPTPVKLDKPAAAADLSTNTPAPLTTAEATAKAAAEVGITNLPPSEISTNATPVISEEIPAARPANLKISDSTEKVLKLVESNLDEQVVLTFVQQTPAKFDLDADEIVYLSDVGVPSTVIAAMLKHDGDDPSKAENITGLANTEDVQPALPATTNLPPAIAQSQPLPGAPQPGQPIEVTTNYIPNQQVVVQQQPQTVVVQQPPTVVYAQPETVTYFYDSLAPYGSWFYVSDYGWCWQPTVAVVDHGWRPYGPRGRWAWTDSGWYWHSDYTWGWAPFHYGRWHMAGARGWIWVPDRTWGPAWVTWRSYGDYCGWAPLPPAAVFRPGIGFSYFGRGVDISFGFGLGYDAFCFAPVGRFHNRRVYDYCLPRHEVSRVYARSHVANRWEFNRGGHEFVNRATARVETGARPAVVRTMSESDRRQWGNRERVDRGGRETVIYRPPPPAPSTSATTRLATDRRDNRGGATPNWSPRTRAEVGTRPSTASGIAAQAGTPNPIESRRFDRGSSDRNQGGQVTTRPSDLAGRSAPTTAGEGRIINSATRDRRSIVSRTPQVAGAPAPVTTTPAPATISSRPTAGLPAPSTSTPGIGSSADTSSRIQSPQLSTPPLRTARPAGEPQVLDRTTRRPLADAAPVTPTPAPGTPRFSTAPRTITTPSTPAPAPTTVTPSRPTTIAPRSISPPPQTVAPAPRTITPSPRIISPPPASAAPTRIAPSAPTYSAPAYTPPSRGNSGGSPAPITRAPAISAPSAPPPVSRAPVTQAPASRGGEASRAGAPHPVSRGRGRD